MPEIFTVITQPNRTEAPEHVLRRTLWMVEAPTNGRLLTTPEDRARLTMPYRLFLRGRAAVATLTAWYDAHLGAQTAFWVPSYVADLLPTTAVAAADTTITVAAIGYTDTLFLYEARRHLALIATDGTITHRLVVDATDNGDGTETLTLDQAAGVDLDPAQGAGLLSFLRLVRLADDPIEIEWVTSEAAECVLSLVECTAEVAIHYPPAEPPLVPPVTPSPTPDVTDPSTPEDPAPDPLDPGGTPEGATGVDFVEDFSTYASTAAWLADSRNIYNRSEDLPNATLGTAGSDQLTLDTGTHRTGYVRSARFFYKGTASSTNSVWCVNHSIGRMFDFAKIFRTAGGTPIPVVELAFRAFITWTPGFHTENPNFVSQGCGAGAPDKKLFRGYPSAGDHSTYFSVKDGVEADESWLAGWWGNPFRGIKTTRRSSLDWDAGAWREVIGLWKCSSASGTANGIAKHWINGTALVTKLTDGAPAQNPLAVDTGSQRTIGVFAMGVNMNQRVEADQSMYIQSLEFAFNGRTPSWLP